MKVVLIGDIHGRSNWKRIVREHKDADEFVFFGDYFDPYEYRPFHEQKRNFESIFDFALDSDKKVVMLLGNHDLHYYCDVEKCSRFDMSNAGEIQKLLEDAMLHMDVAYQFDNVLCTHAGLSPKWLDKWIGKWDASNVADKVTALHDMNTTPFGFYENDFSGFGDDPSQGPMWIRPRSLIMANKEDNRLDSLVQVFGHSQLEDIIESHNVLLNEFDGKFFMVDALEHGGYIVYQDSVFTPYILDKKQVD